MTKVFLSISRHFFAKLVEFYFRKHVLFLSKLNLYFSNLIWKGFLMMYDWILTNLYKKFIENIKIKQIAKIKILQIITKTNTTFTNVNLITWKWNFDYKIRYEEQCFSLPFLWIFQYKKVFFLKSNFLYTMDVSRNEESHVSVTTSLIMALHILQNFF